jgi:hypothetical protein
MCIHNNNKKKKKKKKEKREKKGRGDTFATEYFPRYLQIGFDIQKTVHRDIFL